MVKRFRLKTRAQMHGEVREAGYVFTLAEGEVGPHRTVSQRPDVNIADHIGQDVKVVDEPLYEELSAEQNEAIEEADAKKIEEADAHAKTCQEAAERTSEGVAPPEPEQRKLIEDRTGENID